MVASFNSFATTPVHHSTGRYCAAPPQKQRVDSLVDENPAKGFVVWGAVGAGAGLILSVGVVAALALLAGLRRRRRDDQFGGGDEGGVDALQMKAEAFARYRYG